MNREEVIQYIKDIYAIGDDDDSRHHNEVMDYLIKVLTAVPEREKGEWIESTYQFCGRTFSCIRCSNCDNPQDYFRTTHFCPNCGADMQC